MPRIDDSKIKSKGFQKKPLRPWDLGVDDFKLTSDVEEKSDGSSLQESTETLQKKKVNPKKPTFKTKIEILPVVGKVKLDTNITQNATQTRHKLDTEHNTGGHQKTVMSIVGVQKDLLTLIYNTCKATRTRYSIELTTEFMAEALVINKGSIKTTLARLMEKGFLKWYQAKEGRGGWVKYEIPDFVFNEMLHYESHYKLDTNITQNATQTRHKLDTEHNTGIVAPSKNGADSGVTESGRSPALLSNLDLPEDWLEIDTSELKEIGLGRQHLVQIHRGGVLNAEMVQDSIHAFAFDLYTNKKKVDTPLALFMGTLSKKGIPYSPPQNYESPKDKAFRLWTEQKRKESESRNKIESEALEHAYYEWKEMTSNEDQMAIISDKLAKAPAGHLKDSAVEQELKEFFSKKIWPDKKRSLGGK